jgi:hypothetical protein
MSAASIVASLRHWFWGLGSLTTHLAVLQDRDRMVWSKLSNLTTSHLVTTLQNTFVLKNFTPISSNEKLFTSPTDERFSIKIRWRNPIATRYTNSRSGPTGAAFCSYSTCASILSWTDDDNDDDKDDYTRNVDRYVAPRRSWDSGLCLPTISIASQVCHRSTADGPTQQCQCLIKDGALDYLNSWATVILRWRTATSIT